MLQRLRKSQDEKGFTLIELLVVVLIIAILAAIAIPVFLRQREKGYIADVTSTLRNAATAAESWSTENGGSYEDFSTSNDFADVRFPDGATLSVEEETATGYCIELTDPRLADHDDWDVGHFDSDDGAPQPGACGA
jgi:type IV pilus assembly protein PilA